MDILNKIRAVGLTGKSLLKLIDITDQQMLALVDIAIELKKRKRNGEHIDNPLIHNHQDNSETFLKKTEEATYNLWKIHDKMGQEKASFAQEVKSLKYFIQLQKFHLTALTSQCISLCQKQIVNNLLSKHPHIRLLDLLKILWLCKAAKEA